MTDVESISISESPIVKNLVEHEYLHQSDVLATQILSKLHTATISNPAQLLQQLLNFDQSDQQEIQSIIQEAEWSFIEIIAAYLHNQRTVAHDNEAASANKQNVQRVLSQQYASVFQELSDIIEIEVQAQKNRGVLRNLNKQKQQQQQQQMEQEQDQLSINAQQPVKNIVTNQSAELNKDPQQEMSNLNSTNLYNSLLENLYLQQQLQQTQHQNELLKQQYSGSLANYDPNQNVRMSVDSNRAPSFESSRDPNQNIPSSSRQANMISQGMGGGQGLAPINTSVPGVGTRGQMGAKFAGLANNNNDLSNNPYFNVRNNQQQQALLQRYLNQIQLENNGQQAQPSSFKSNSIDNNVNQQYKPKSPHDRRSWDVDLRSQQAQNIQNLLNNYRGSLDNSTLTNSAQYNDLLSGGLQNLMQQQNFNANDFLSQQQQLNSQNMNRMKLYQNQLLSQMQNQSGFNQMAYPDLQQVMQQQIQNNYLQQLQRGNQNQLPVNNPNISQAYLSSFYNTNTPGGNTAQ